MARKYWEEISRYIFEHAMSLESTLLHMPISML